MNLTKKQKADFVCYLLNIGAVEYDDNCEWIPHLHKYRFESHYDGITKVVYPSQKELASHFNHFYEIYGESELNEFLETKRANQ